MNLLYCVRPTGPSENTTYPSAATIQTTPAAPKCPDGWIEQNERCYSLSINDSLSWPEARLACQQTPGGDLLVYNSTEEKRSVYIPFDSIICF